MPVTLLPGLSSQACNQKALWVSSNSLLIQFLLLLLHALIPPVGPEYPNTQDYDRQRCCDGPVHPEGLPVETIHGKQRLGSMICYYTLSGILA